MPHGGGGGFHGRVNHGMAHAVGVRPGYGYGYGGGRGRGWGVSRPWFGFWRPAHAWYRPWGWPWRWGWWWPWNAAYLGGATFPYGYCFWLLFLTIGLGLLATLFAIGVWSLTGLTALVLVVLIALLLSVCCCAAAVHQNETAPAPAPPPQQQQLPIQTLTPAQKPQPQSQTTAAPTQQVTVITRMPGIQPQQVTYLLYPEEPPEQAYYMPSVQVPYSYPQPRLI